MSRVLLFLLSILSLTPQMVNSDLEDQVKGQLEELKALIKGTISQAVDELDNLYEEMVAHSLNLQEEAIQRIDSQHQSVVNNLKSLDDQAEIKGKDVSTCTSGKELIFQQMNDDARERMTIDIEHNNMEGTQFLEKTKYEVDTVINEVGNLEFQLERCGGQILCISPIEGEISRNMVRLPQSIRIQVDEVTSSIDVIKVMVKELSDGTVADFNSRVIPLITNIVICAHKILDRP